MLISVQLLSCVQLFATPWTAGHQASLSIPNSWGFLRFTSIKSVKPSNHLILCHPLLLFPGIRVFSSESVLHIRWPKYWSFSFSISTSKEYWGLISFRIDWLNLLAVQETLKSLFQHRSSKAPILWWWAFFIVQLSHPYMTTGKNIALTRWTFVSKVMSLLFNMLSSLVIAFLQRGKCFFFNFMAAVTICSDFGAPQNKVHHCFHCFPIYCHEVMGPDAMIIVFWMLSFKPAFTLSSVTLIQWLFSSSLFSAITVVSSAYLRLLYFSWQSWFQLVLHPAWPFTWCTLHIS